MVSQVVSGDPVLEYRLVAGAREEMLALARRVLGPDLVAVDALGRHALVVLVGLELDKGGVDLAEGELVEPGLARVLRLEFLAGMGRAVARAEGGPASNSYSSYSYSYSSGGRGAVDSGVGGEAQGGVIGRAGV